MSVTTLDGMGERLALPEGLFERFRALIERGSGIHLSASKRAHLAARLAPRLRAHALESYAEYLKLAEADPEEQVRLLESVCIHETHFFREPQHFEFLSNVALSQWRERARRGERPRRIRVWSAACSTGEEPYSLAMLLHDQLAREVGWEFEILASDFSSGALERARSATYSMDKAEEIPEDYRKRFMLRGVRGQAGRMRVAPEVRASVRFEQINLHASAYPIPRGLDLILCRNVLIYFAPEARPRVVQRLFDLLNPDGYLMLGHAESMVGLMPRVRVIRPAVYMRSDAAAGGSF